VCFVFFCVYSCFFVFFTCVFLVFCVFLVYCQVYLLPDLCERQLCISGDCCMLKMPRNRCFFVFFVVFLFVFVFFLFYLHVFVWFFVFSWPSVKCTCYPIAVNTNYVSAATAVFEFVKKSCFCNATVQPTFLFAIN
jgi:hypothetical protein